MYSVVRKFGLPQTCRNGLYRFFLLLFKDFWVLFFVNSPAHWKNTLFYEVSMIDCGRYSQRPFLNYNLKQYFTYLEPCSTVWRLIRFIFIITNLRISRFACVFCIAVHLYALAAFTSVCHWVFCAMLLPPCSAKKACSTSPTRT